MAKHRCRLDRRTEHAIPSTEIPLSQAQEEAFRVSPLAQSIRALYTGIKEQSCAKVLVGDIPIDFRLPIRQEKQQEEWTLWGNVPSDSSDEDSSSESASSLDRKDVRAAKSKIVASLKPWKTLLAVRPRVLRAGFKRQLARRRTGSKLGPFNASSAECLVESPDNSEAVDALLAALDPSST